MFESVIANVLNNFLGDYVENFQPTQLNIAIWNGDVKLKNLRLKKEALDKLKLPLEFKEGYLGELTMKIPWHNLKNLPVRIYISNIYLLISPKDEINLDPKEEEEKAHRLKLKKLETFELLKAKNNIENQEDELKSASFANQLITKIVDNLQVSIKNIHLRYEDALSNPDNPFAVGITLSEVSALSTDENWQEALTNQASDVIRKLLTLNSLGIYWDTNAQSLGGKPINEAIKIFMDEISNNQNSDCQHQFILKPVIADGKLVVNQRYQADKPKTTAGLNFDEISLILDDEQTRDFMLTASRFDFVMRKRNFIQFSPPRHLSYSLGGLEWFRFAARCILSGIQEKNRQWTWEFFSERREDRLNYIELYIKVQLETIEPEDLEIFNLLERKLKFRDIKFYRTLAQSELTRQKSAIKKKKEEEAQSNPSWFGSVLGWTGAPPSISDKDASLSDEQLQKLYSTIDYDEETALHPTEYPKDFVLFAIKAQLGKASVALRIRPHSDTTDLITLGLTDFEVDFLQRTDSFKAWMSLNGLELLDGSDSKTLYPHLVKVSKPYVENNDKSASDSKSEPFLTFTYEHNPLDGRSDDAVTLKMLNLQLFYKPELLQTITTFFKPPTPAHDSVSALIEAAGSRFEGLKKQTTASLQYALEDHRTLDVHVDIYAPLFIVPHSFTDPDAIVVVLDSGHMNVDSVVIDKAKKNELQGKQNSDFTTSDFKKLESLMYDKLNLELTSVQLVAGTGLAACLDAINPSTPTGDLHIVDRINMNMDLFMSILPQVSHLTKFRVAGHLPLFHVNFSKYKYNALMATLDILFPPDVDEAKSEINTVESRHHEDLLESGTTGSKAATTLIFDEDEGPELYGNSSESELCEDEDEFYDAEDDTQQQIEAKHTNLNAKLFVLDFTIDKLNVSLRKENEVELADAHLDGFTISLIFYPFHMAVGLIAQKLTMFDKVFPDSRFCHVLTSATSKTDRPSKDLMNLSYTRVYPESPELDSRFEGITQLIDAGFSTIDIYITQKTILELYYFIFETFFPEEPNSAAIIPDQTEKNEAPITLVNTTLIKTRMESISLILNDNDSPLCTLSFGDGDLTLLITQASIRLNAKLGNMAMEDGGNYGTLLSIDSEEAAEIRYESFSNPTVDLGYDTLINANFGAARLVVIESTMERLLAFFSRFAEMRGLFETARLAALNSASQLQEQVSRFQFEILMKSPKILLPRSDGSKDVLTANLGELSLKNHFSTSTVKDVQSQLLNNISLKLSSIFLSSHIFFPEFNQELEIIENIDLAIDVIMAEFKSGSVIPENKTSVTMSPIVISVTRGQYKLLLDIFNKIMRLWYGQFASQGIEDNSENVFSAEQNNNLSLDAVDAKNSPSKQDNSHITLDISFSLKKLLFEIYNNEHPDKLAESKLAKVSLNDTNIKYIFHSDETTDLQAEIHSFVVQDCRSDFDHSFREIIPAITHEGPQFMAQMTTKSDGSSNLLVTVDSPKVIFALDYLLALKSFALSPFDQSDSAVPHSTSGAQASSQNEESSPSPATMVYRVNVVDAEIVILSDLRNPSSEAIVFSIQQLIISQQGILTLTVGQVGMFLCQMNERDKTALRFIETFDVVLTMDDRVAKPGHRLTNIAVDVKPLILRLSYRDVTLISDIFNKFSTLTYSETNNPDEQPSGISEITLNNDAVISNNQMGHGRSMSTSSRFSRNMSNQASLQVVPRENLRLSVQGLKIILIRDAYDLPIVDLSTDPFTIEVSDWTNHLKAELQMALHVNFYNIKNSHWEPFIEPWSFSLAISKPTQHFYSVDFQSKKLLDINITPAIIETSVSFMEEIQTVNPLSVARGVHIPFLLRNRTGYTMHVWGISNRDTEEIEVQRIEDGSDTPWRFDDWRKMRESVIQARNTLGLQFEQVTWESIKDIRVDQEGIEIYTLRPLLNGIAHRLVCEVALQDNIKVVTFRSPLQIHNATLLPMEMVVVDTKREHLSPIKTILPGEKCAVPIEYAYRFGIIVRPSAGFGYGWSTQYLYWREFLISSPLDSILCPAEDPNDPSFYIQVFGEFHIKDPIIANYPNITFRLSAPLELENLLPYDIRFKLYDNNNIEWPSFLRRGGVCPIHMVDVTQKLQLSLHVCDTSYKPSGKIPIAFPTRHNENQARYITLRDPSNLELNLQTSFIAIPRSGGSFKISIFCPYVLLNKTGLDMYFKTQSITRQSKIASGQDNHVGKVAPFLFSYGRSEHRKRALIKVGPSEWSHPVSFEATGSVSELVLKLHDRQEQIHLGVSIEEGIGKYHLTKLVTFTPRFIVKNDSSIPINFRVIASSSSFTVSPGERAPLYYISPRDGDLLTIQYPGVFNVWSSPFKISTVGKIHVQLTKADHSLDLIKVDILLQGATLFIIFAKEEGKWPFRIENLSETDVVFHQTVDSKSNTHREPNKYKLSPGKAVPYSWDFPAIPEKSLTLIAGTEKRVINFQQIGAMVPLKIKSNRKSMVVAIDVIAEGPTQVLRLSKYIESESLFRPAKSNVNRRASLLTSSSDPGLSSSSGTNYSTNYGFEVVEQQSQVTFAFTLKLEGIGCSLINRRHQELVYATIREIELKFNDYTDSQSINLKVKWVQMDNMLYEALFPIVLYPTVISKNGNETNLHPTLQIVATRSKDASNNVEMFKYFTFLLQEISLEIDEDFLFALLDFVKYSLSETKSSEESNLLYDGQLELPEPNQLEESFKMYFSLLHIQPLKVNLSFIRTEHINQEEVQPSSRNPLTLLVDVLTMAIGNINDAPIKFNSLVLENLLADYTVLIDRLTSYYGQEFVYQIHKVVGSVDVLGNPVGLFTNLSSGVVDIFYEPYQGIVMSDRPQDFGIGLARGTASFVKKTVFGFSDSFSKITDSLGKGLAEVTMDRSFIDRRRLSKSRNRPKHALYGVANGANSLGSSMASGFAGVLTQPIEGAERDGVGGFFSGLGKGLVGVVAKPMVGAFDLVSNVAEGIRNTTTVFDGDPIDRVRLPRYIAPDGILKLYSQREALGQKWLYDFKDGKYVHEGYLAHYDLGNAQTIVMLTSARVMQLRLRNMSLEWEMPFSEMQSVHIDAAGISFVAKHGLMGPFVPISDVSSRRWFASRVDQAFDKFLQSQRALE